MTKNITGDCPEITIKAKKMTNYKEYVPFVLRWEGGKSDSIYDKGGLTNKGVTYSTYQAVCVNVFGKKPTKEHFLSLTDDEVGLVVKYFWDKSTYFNRIESQKIAEAITGWRWGSGDLGLQWWQMMLNKEFGCNLVVDGIIGKASIAAINSIDPDVLFRKAIEYRMKRFLTICEQDASQYNNLVGWLRRLNDFATRHGEGEYYKTLAKENPYTIPKKPKK